MCCVVCVCVCVCVCVAGQKIAKRLSRQIARETKNINPLTGEAENSRRGEVLLQTKS